MSMDTYICIYMNIAHLSEHYVFSVEPVARVACDEELAAVGVWPRIRHRQQPRSEE